MSSSSSSSSSSASSSTSSGNSASQQKRPREPSADQSTAQGQPASKKQRCSSSHVNIICERLEEADRKDERDFTNSKRFAGAALQLIDTDDVVDYVVDLIHSDEITDEKQIDKILTAWSAKNAAKPLAVNPSQEHEERIRKAQQIGQAKGRRVRVDDRSRELIRTAFFKK